MADLEGALETRGPGKVGKWEQFWFKLSGGSLACFNLDDAVRSTPKSQFSLQDVSNLVEDGARREFSFDCLGVKARFRADDADEVHKWFAALKARAPVGTLVTQYRDESPPRSVSPKGSPRSPRGAPGVPKYYWIQCDTVGSLASDGRQPGTYAVRARWRAAADAQETELRDAVVRPGNVGLEDCFVRQQVLLTTAHGQRTVLVSVVRREAEESTLIGTCELNVENAAHRVAATYELLNRKGEKIGVTARLKIKQADPSAAPLPVQEAAVSPTSSAPVSPAASTPVRSTSSSKGRTVSRGASARSAPRSPRGASQSQLDRSLTSEYDVPEGWGSPQSPQTPQESTLATIPTEPSTTAVFTGSAMFASRSSSPHRASIHRASSLRRKSEEAFDADQVPGMLDAIIKLLDENRLRVADLFRHPQYNPDFLESRKEELDAKALQGVLLRAGLDFESRSCRMLVRCLDETGSGTVNITELESAVRARRRGKDKFCEVIRKATTSKLDFSRHMSCGSAINSPEVCLDAISDLLDAKHLRVHDLFRHPQYNPQYLETGCEEMDAEMLHAVLSKAGLELLLQDVTRLVEAIDTDAGGTVSIDELEHVLRTYRRGIKVWEDKDFIERKQAALQRQRSRRRSRSAQHAASVKLYSDHAEKLQALEQRKLQAQREEDIQIATEVELGRVGTRRHTAVTELTTKPLNQFKGLQLHEHFKELQARHKERVRQHHMEERARIMSTKPEPSYRPASPDERQNVKDIGDRLYQLAVDRREDLKRRQVESEVEALKNLKTPDRVIRPGDKDRCQFLYEDAQNRKDRLEQNAKKHALEEVRYWAEMAEKRQSHTPTAEQHNEHIEELHKAHAARREKLLKLQEEAQAREKQSIEKEKESLRSKSCPITKRYREQAVAKWKEPQNLSASQKEELKRRVELAHHEKGFGSSTPRARFDDQIVKPHDFVEKKQVSYAMHTAAEHCIETVNAVVAMRTGSLPAAAPINELSSMAALCEEVLGIFAEAAANCRNLSSAALDQMQSQRIYNDKELVPDEIGFQHCIEPCPLMQKTEDLDQLLQEAERAHWALLAKIGPQETSTMSDLSAQALIQKRWPAGSRWHNPVAARGATFAYNPGPKSKEAAWAKAFTRYGPTVGDTRHRHMLDLARCTLVFPNQTLLRNGLQQIIQDFRVVGIHNFYNPRHQNLLGDRYIVVYVIVTEGLEVPHICELRLEEAAFFAARQDAEPILHAIGQRFAEIYGHMKSTTPPGCVKYLVRHILQKNKPPHSLAVFRRHLARHYGSSVVAWRRMLGNAPTASFNSFREVCCQLALRKQTVEFWTELDPTLAGCISLFDLDPSAVALLARFYSHLLGSVDFEGDSSPEALFQKLASRTPANKPNKPGRLEAHEFRQAVKVFGFTWQEADRIFQYLDFMGGSAHVPPATVTVKDIGWLRSLSELVNIDMAMMTTADELPPGMGSTIKLAGSANSAMLGAAVSTTASTPTVQEGASTGRAPRMSLFLAGAAHDFGEQQRTQQQDELQRQTEDASRRIAQGKARRSLMAAPDSPSPSPSQATGHEDEYLDAPRREDSSPERRGEEADDDDGASSMGSLGSPRSPRSAASRSPPAQERRAADTESDVSDHPSDLEEDGDSQYSDEEALREQRPREAEAAPAKQPAPASQPTDEEEDYRDSESEYSDESGHY